MRTGRMTKVPTDHGNVALVHKDACSSFIVNNRGNPDIYHFVPRDVADTKMRAWKKQMASLPRHRQLEAERMQVV